MDFTYASICKWVEHNGLMYSVNSATNDVVIMDRLNMEIIDIIPICVEREGVPFFNNYFVGIAATDTKFFLFPYHYEGLMVSVDFENGQKSFSKFSIASGYQAQCLPHGIGRRGHELWFVPLKIKDPFIVFDMRTECFHREELLSESIVSEFGEEEIPFENVTEIGNELWISSKDLLRKIVIDMSTLSVRLYKLPFKFDSYRDFSFDSLGRDLWFYSSIENNLIKMDRNTEKYERYEFKNKDYRWKIVAYNLGVLLISEDSRNDVNIFCFDITEKHFCEMSYSKQIKLLSDYRKSGYSNYNWFERDNNSLWIFPSRADRILKFNCELREVTGINLITPIDSFSKYMQDKLKGIYVLGVVEEKDTFNLKNLLEGKPVCVL